MIKTLFIQSLLYQYYSKLARFEMVEIRAMIIQQLCHSYPANELACPGPLSLQEEKVCKGSTFILEELLN